MIEDHTKTTLALDQIYFEATDTWEDADALLESTQYAMELDGRNLVKEGVIERLKKLNISIDTDDKKHIIKELNRRYVEMGVKEGIPRSVKNWIAGTPVSLDQKNRSNLYNLCISLEMGIEETVEFFLKKYMTIPFNYKDRVDAVYYYGFLRKKTFIEIQNLLEKSESLGVADGTRRDDTKKIAYAMADIVDDEIFLQYLMSHTFDKRQQFQTAKKTINDLLIKCCRIASYENDARGVFISEDERKRQYIWVGEDGKESPNINALLTCIYGFDNQERYRERKTKIAKCEYLPKGFRENFPENIHFSQIESGEASADTYRKAIIILNYYHFFCSSLIHYMYETDCPNKKKKRRTIAEFEKRDDELIEEDLRDFFDETSKVLEDSGFVQMYVRNPFDWLVLFCAKSTDPLDSLRELLLVRFIEKYD